jgi:hypothetical protein
MAAATADRKITTTGVRRSFRGALAAAAVAYVGTLAARNAAGNVVPASDAASVEVVGVFLESVDNSAGAAGDKSISIGVGVFEFVNLAGAIVLASHLALCYVGDDSSVTTAAVAANDVIAGLVVAYTTTTVLVDVDPAYSNPSGGTFATTLDDHEDRLDVLNLGNLGVQTLTGAGAIDLTKGLTLFTSTGAGQAITIADGSDDGQEHTIMHAVDGGSGVLTAGGALHLQAGVATITLTNRWEWARLRWSSVGVCWNIVGCSPVAIVA